MANCDGDIPAYVHARNDTNAHGVTLPDFSMRREVVPAYEELRADPSRAMTREQVEQALDARRKERIAGRLNGKLKAPVKASPDTRPRGSSAITPSAHRIVCSISKRGGKIHATKLGSFAHITCIAIYNWLRSLSVTGLSVPKEIIAGIARS